MGCVWGDLGRRSRLLRPPARAKGKNGKVGQRPIVLGDGSGAELPCYFSPIFVQELRRGYIGMRPTLAFALALRFALAAGVIGVDAMATKFFFSLGHFILLALGSFVWFIVGVRGALTRRTHRNSPVEQDAGRYAADIYRCLVINIGVCAYAVGVLWAMRRWVSGDLRLWAYGFTSLLLALLARDVLRWAVLPRDVRRGARSEVNRTEAGAPASRPAFRPAVVAPIAIMGFLAVAVVLTALMGGC